MIRFLIGVGDRVLLDVKVWARDSERELDEPPVFSVGFAHTEISEQQE